MKCIPKFNEFIAQLEGQLIYPGKVPKHNSEKEIVSCKSCGATETKIIDSYLCCSYCGSQISMLSSGSSINVIRLEELSEAVRNTKI